MKRLENLTRTLVYYWRKLGKKVTIHSPKISKERDSLLDLFGTKRNKIVKIKS